MVQNLKIAESRVFILEAFRKAKSEKAKYRKASRMNILLSAISETVARYRFIEIMRFLRFDYKQTRSHRIATDKLALI